MFAQNHTSPFSYPAAQITAKTSGMETALKLAALSKFCATVHTGFTQAFNANLGGN
jgi:hypothetical protein